MFDADKKRFVEECYPDSEMSRRWVLSTLSLLEDYETRWGMDFTMQALEPLQEAFNHITSITYSGSKTILIRFRKYAKWRIDSGLPCTDSVFKLEANRTTAMQESMVSSPAHLAGILNYVFDDPVRGTVDIIYRVFLWMGFSGLDDIEAIKVTSDEIDFNQMIIHHAGVDYPVYNEAKYDFRIACDLQEFAEHRGSKQRVDGNEIMRGKANKRAQPLDITLIRTIRPTLVRKFDAASQRNQASDNPENIGLDLSFNRVYLSGIFYRFRQQELDGYPPDFTQYAIDEFERVAKSDKPYKVSAKNPKAAILLRIRKSAESDYSNWKAAFNY